MAIDDYLLLKLLRTVTNWGSSCPAVMRYAITDSIAQKPTCCPGYAADFPSYQWLGQQLMMIMMVGVVVENEVGLIVDITRSYSG